MPSVRELITEYRNEVAKGNLVPQRAAEILSQVAALLGNVNEEIVNRKMAYNKVLQEALDSNEKANRARIRAEGSEEYKTMLIAQNTFTEAVELMRSLKYLLRTMDDEQKSANYQ